MGHLLKWVTLAKIIALGDFQSVKVEFFLRISCTRIYVTKQDMVVERKWEKFRKEWSQSNKVYPIFLEFCICSVE